MCYIPYNFICVTCTLFYRWIKFEEDVEEGGERWSKPHVATLSLHSLFELRCSLLTGTVMFDIEPYDLLSLVGRFSIMSLWWWSSRIYFLCGSFIGLLFFTYQYIVNRLRYLVLYECPQVMAFCVSQKN